MRKKFFPELSRNYPSNDVLNIHMRLFSSKNTSIEFENWNTWVTRNHIFWFIVFPIEWYLPFVDLLFVLYLFHWKSSLKFVVHYSPRFVLVALFYFEDENFLFELFSIVVEWFVDNEEVNMESFFQTIPITFDDTVVMWYLHNETKINSSEDFFVSSNYRKRWNSTNDYNIA